MVGALPPVIQWWTISGSIFVEPIACLVLPPDFETGDGPVYFRNRGSLQRRPGRDQRDSRTRMSRQGGTCNRELVLHRNPRQLSLCSRRDTMVQEVRVRRLLFGLSFAELQRIASPTKIQPVNELSHDRQRGRSYGRRGTSSSIVSSSYRSPSSCVLRNPILWQACDEPCPCHPR